jgi:hypothetical protein
MLQAKSDQARPRHWNRGGQRSHTVCCLRRPTWCRGAVSGAREGETAICTRERRSWRGGESAVFGAGGAQWAELSGPWFPTSPRCWSELRQPRSGRLFTVCSLHTHLPTHAHFFGGSRAHYLSPCTGNCNCAPVPRYVGCSSHHAHTFAG